MENLNETDAIYKNISNITSSLKMSNSKEEKFQCLQLWTCLVGKQEKNQ